MAEDFFQLVLQAPKRHVRKEEQARRKEIDKTQQETGAAGMLIFHGRHSSMPIRMTRFSC